EEADDEQRHGLPSRRLAKLEREVRSPDRGLDSGRHQQEEPDHADGVEQRGLEVEGWTLLYRRSVHGRRLRAVALRTGPACSTREAARQPSLRARAFSFTEF